MNIRELAELAGVSASTVSKIMNNKDSRSVPPRESAYCGLQSSTIISPTLP